MAVWETVHLPAVFKSHRLRVKPIGSVVAFIYLF